jgi:polyferredoxin
MLKKSIHLLIQIAFLVLFFVLIKAGRIQVWMGIFLAGIAISFLKGRVYCGFICPINTAIQTISYIKKKLEVKDMKYPKFLAYKVTRVIFLIGFIAIFIIVIKTGRKLPVLPVLFVFGVVLSIFFHQELWHRYLCPYGTILNISSKTANTKMVVDEDKCNNCSICKRVCKGHAVEKKEKHYIKQNDCLVCFECERNCKQKAIEYK